MNKDFARCDIARTKRLEGKSFAEIGVEMGVNRDRARQMVLDSERRKKALLNADKEPLRLLSVRTMNCILAEGWMDKDRNAPPTPKEIRDWIASGRLRNTHNIGKKAFAEIEAWLSGLGA